VTGSIVPHKWSEFLLQEYLHDYIPAGGAAIKFPVPLNPSARSELFNELQVLSSMEAFATFWVDAAETRVYMTDQIFFRIAEQIKWRELGRRVVLRLLREEGYAIPDATGDTIFQSIAEHNELPPEFLLGELKRRLAEKVFRRRDLAKDFRVAMMQICLHTAIGGVEGVLAIDTITDWLTGVNRNIAPVKPYQIYNRIGRHNARHLLESLFRWNTFVGYLGTIVILDIERLALPKNPKDGSVYYTKAALLDGYEVFREFIDSADRLSSVLLIVIPATEFLDEESLSRGMGAYEALKFRVYDEVRDRQLANPMMALVRIGTSLENDDQSRH
jgi:hypothetical protein